jgi:hypothetical protein
MTNKQRIKRFYPLPPLPYKPFFSLKQYRPRSVPLTDTQVNAINMEYTDDGVLHDFVDTLHAGSVLSRLQELRDRKELCDVTLVVEGREIVVHRAVLAATSQYFNALFTSPMSEKNMKTVSTNTRNTNSYVLSIFFNKIH